MAERPKGIIRHASNAPRVKTWLWRAWFAQKQCLWKSLPRLNAGTLKRLRVSNAWKNEKRRIRVTAKSRMTLTITPRTRHGMTSCKILPRHTKYGSFNFFSAPFLSLFSFLFLHNVASKEQMTKFSVGISTKLLFYIKKLRFAPLAETFFALSLLSWCWVAVPYCTSLHGPPFSPKSMAFSPFNIKFRYTFSLSSLLLPLIASKHIAGRLVSKC